MILTIVNGKNNNAYYTNGTGADDTDAAYLTDMLPINFNILIYGNGNLLIW